MLNVGLRPPRKDLYILERGEGRGESDRSCRWAKKEKETARWCRETQCPALHCTAVDGEDTGEKLGQEGRPK